MWVEREDLVNDFYLNVVMALLRFAGNLFGNCKEKFRQKIGFSVNCQYESLMAMAN